MAFSSLFGLRRLFNRSRSARKAIRGKQPANRRALFDSLEDPSKYEFDTKSFLDRSNYPRVVVIRNRPNDANEQRSLLQSLVVTRFPNSRTIGRFTVYWRP